MTHDELQNDLAAHLRGGTDRMVWTNTQLGPSGSPRPDVFTLNKSFSRFRSDCYEIKVSVADLRHDVTSGKWQSYRKFGHAVWFAFPRGMAPLDLVPKECGIILRGEGWRAARKPVAQVLDTLPRDAWLKLLMSGIEEEREARPRHINEWRAAELANKKWGEELAELFRARGIARRQYEHATAAMTSSAGEIEREVHRRKQLAQEQLTRDMGNLDQEVLRLAEALGLSGDVTISQVAQEMRVFRAKLKPLNTWELDQAIKSLTKIKDRMEAAEAVSLTGA